MDIDVVIGANYGDEGKGLATNWLCKNMSKPIVVMSNGGCQRGHTVYDKGIRHVFSHFGSGTFADAHTYFPKTYFMNPMRYVEELYDLDELGVKPVCFRDKDCLMQFPVDTCINRVLECSRKSNGVQHGSVGWGIWETVKRNEVDPMTVQAYSKLSRAGKVELYTELSKRSIEREIDNAKLSEPALDLFKRMTNYMFDNSFIEHFIDDFETMAKYAKILDFNSIFSSNIYTNVVFECGQGLLLDSSYSGDTIHATPSETGLNGVDTCINSSMRSEGCSGVLRDAQINVNYVTRTYLTRHGAGPFDEYDPDFEINDKTNVQNDWQDSIRAGYFTDGSIEYLKSRVLEDFSNNLVATNKKMNVIATHCNELAIPEALDSFITHVSYDETNIFV